MHVPVSSFSPGSHSPLLSLSALLCLFLLFCPPCASNLADFPTALTLTLSDQEHGFTPAFVQRIDQCVLGAGAGGKLWKVGIRQEKEKKSEASPQAARVFSLQL